MRKNFLRTSLHLVCIGLLLTNARQILSGPCLGPIPWPGTSQTDTSLIINAGTTTLAAGGTTIRAASCDLTIQDTLPGSTVQGNGGGASVLYLMANNGHTITFNLANPLNFFGSVPAGANRELLIIVGTETPLNPGSVTFNVPDNTTVNSLVFGAAPGGSGTKLYLVMQEPNALPTNPFTALIFQRANAASANDATIEVGQGSLIGYLAPTSFLSGSEEIGTIFFNPTNIGSGGNFGKLNLLIDNGGGVAVFGSLITPFGTAVTSITLANIDPTILAGEGTSQGAIPTGAGFEVINVSSAGTVVPSFLVIDNQNQIYPSLKSDPFCCNLSTPTVSTGFVIGANGILAIDADAYVEYVGTATNTCLVSTCTQLSQSSIKPRNASALIIDGLSPRYETNCNTDPETSALILFAPFSGLYFVSGVDKNGVVENYNGVPFAINPALRTPGTGNFVLDVEGLLTVTTDDTQFPGRNAIEILSLAVNQTGGPVRQDVGAPFVFPMRTFQRDANGNYIQYNCGAFLINDRVNLFNVTLVHSDTCHQVFENDDVNSEPTYVGGEHWLLCGTGIRPKIAFYNSQFYVENSVALTGVDLFVPFGFPYYDDPSGNVSDFQFFQNGKVVDNCTGRQMILGTLIGSTACDSCTIISRDAHLDIFSDCVFPGPGRPPLELLLTTTWNTGLVTQGIGNGFPTQYDLQNIYLGWASNISIGREDSTDFGTNPELLIDGNYFSFSTRGGLTCTPDLSNVTGQGGIFVDTNGLISIAPFNRATFSAMVTKNRNGSVNLPKNQVFFNVREGVAEWRLDLTDPTQRVIIPANSTFETYTLNWLATTKDYANFMPYDTPTAYACSCPTVTRMNVSSLPTVAGEINKFILQGSRFGCPASLLVDCGWIKELVFLKEFNAGEEPTAVVVLQNEGRIGVGTDETDTDSIFAQTRFGVNGYQIIANGDGQIDLNQDMVIDNVCTILKGPDFNSTSTNRLIFNSVEPRSLTVRPNGSLNLMSFTSTDTIVFKGNINLVFEPGSRLILGTGVTVRFEESAQITIEPDFSCHPVNGTSVQQTNCQRVRWVGQGTIVLDGNTQMTLNRHAYLGIETLVSSNQILEGDTCNPTDLGCTVTLTNIALQVLGNAQVRQGDGFAVPGGILQVGNVFTPFDTNNGTFIFNPTNPFTQSQIFFSILINGSNARWRMGSQAMLGLGVGIANDVDNRQNNWLVDTLNDVVSITLTFSDGTFVMNHAVDGTNPANELMAIGNTATRYNLEPTVNEALDGLVLGGGNVVLIDPAPITSGPTCFADCTSLPCITSACVTGTSIFAPTTIRPGVFQCPGGAGGLCINSCNGTAFPAFAVSCSTLGGQLLQGELDTQLTPLRSPNTRTTNINGLVLQGTAVAPIVLSTCGVSAPRVRACFLASSQATSAGSGALPIDPAADPIVNPLTPLQLFTLISGPSVTNLDQFAATLAPDGTAAKSVLTVLNDSGTIFRDSVLRILDGNGLPVSVTNSAESNGAVLLISPRLAADNTRQTPELLELSQATLPSGAPVN